MTENTLPPHQQDLINLVRAAHANLALARKTYGKESLRRKAEARIASERALEEAIVTIDHDIQVEITEHEAALDEALIAAYNDGIPITKIANLGFGNRYPGGVMQLITKLREQGLVGFREGYHRNALSEDEVETRVVFPQPLELSEEIAERTLVKEPSYLKLEEPIVLLEADGKLVLEDVTAPAVLLTLDPRDPYLRSIARNAMPESPVAVKNAHATSATLYFHPANGNLVAVESKESNENYWEHPVARYVKDHYDEAFASVAALLAPAE